MDDDDDQGYKDPEPGAVASSTSDATVRDAKHASAPLRRVRAGEGRWEDFLYELKAGQRAASGRPRPAVPHAALSYRKIAQIAWDAPYLQMI